MDVPARIVLACPADRRGSLDRAEADVEPGIELHPAEVDEAPGLHRDVGEPHRLPEAQGNPRPQAAEAQRQVGVVGIGPVRRPDLEPADRDRKQAGPADIGDRVDEAAGAAARTRSGAGGTAQRQAERAKRGRGDLAKTLHGLAPLAGGRTISLTSSSWPCCRTRAGTARIAKCALSLPPWSK